MNNIKNTLLKLIFIFFPVLLVILTSCSQEQVKKQTNQKVTPQNKQGVSNLDKNRFKLATTALKNGELKKSEKLFFDFIKHNPDIASPYSNLALIFYKHNDFNKSFKYINKAIKLNPKQPESYNLRAQLYIKNGDIHKAKDDYLLAIETKPDYLLAHYNLALLYDIYLQEIELAVKHYKIYLSLINTPDEPTKEWLNHLEGTLKDA